MKRLLQIFGGCGVAVAVIIALVAWLLTGHGTSQKPVPENIPPVEGKEVAHIDVNAPGRTADKLTYWASDLAEQTGIPLPPTTHQRHRPRWPEQYGSHSRYR